jgi:hypothetical protein
MRVKESRRRFIAVTATAIAASFSLSAGAARADGVCGLLRYKSGGAPGTTYYDVTGEGCVTIYLTDAQGNMQSSMQYQCHKGAELSVDGYHSFGCSC